MKNGSDDCSLFSDAWILVSTKIRKTNGQVLDINVSRLACAFEMEWQNSTTEVIMLIILRRAKSNINLQFN